MIIHQLQATYQAQQDRILLRLNTTTNEEFRLWLTRRMLLSFLPQLMKVTSDMTSKQPQLASHDSANPQALAHFKKQEAVALADFDTPFKAEVMTLPIGSEPLLASTVHMIPINNEQLTLGFEEPAQGDAAARNFSVTMDSQVFHSLLHLLETVLKHADWGLALTATPESEIANALDDFADAKPPIYLN